MTYTQPSTEIDLSIIPGEDSAVIAKKMQAAGQIQIARDIARLKAMGKPIHYTIGKKLIREEANGQKFELLIREDGSEEIIGEII
jgi:predicted DNA-binding transcriptional regulator YafY